MGRDFGDVLRALRNGSTASRNGWNGKGQYIGIAPPGNDDPMTLPYLFISTVGGQRVPWVASQTDLLANDWEIVS